MPGIRRLLTPGGRLFPLFAKATRALGTLGAEVRLLPDQRILSRVMLAREAHLSSMIEGTQSTYRQLLIFERDESIGRGNDTREVHNFVNAVSYALSDERRVPMSLPLLKRMHEILLSEVRGEEKRPGEFRRRQNWIGPRGCSPVDARFVPPPPEPMLELLHEYEHAMQRPSSEGMELVDLAVLHYQFEAIHPFLDGNGRIGRAIIVILMSEWGLLATPVLHLSAYFHRHDAAYRDLLLAVSRSGDWEGWIAFFLEGVSQQACDASLRARTLNELLERHHRILDAAAGVPGRNWGAVLRTLHRQILITPAEVAEILGASPATAYRLVRRMNALGIIEDTGAKAARTGASIYMARDVVDAIERDYVAGAGGGS